MYHQVLIAGFGGQGVLSCGVVLAMAAMIEEKHVTWMPSYGPEQRGGTARCIVTISARPIGSPLMERLSCAIIFNQPSLTKFLPSLPDGSLLILDSCIVQSTPECHRHHLFEVPSENLAKDTGLIRAGNVVLLGSYIAACGVVSVEAAKEGIARYLGTSKPHLVEANQRALFAGYDYLHLLRAA